MLIGLSREGKCPECGTDYTDETAARLKPWPGALVICLELGWPLLILGGVVAVLSAGTEDMTALALLIVGYIALLALPINTYFRVRARLKQHVPNQRRTTGGLLAFRVLGTTACVLGLIAILLPAILLGACLVMFSLDGGI